VPGRADGNASQARASSASASGRRILVAASRALLPVEAEEGLCGIRFARKQLLERCMPAGASAGQALQSRLR